MLGAGIRQGPKKVEPRRLGVGDGARKLATSSSRVGGEVGSRGSSWGSGRSLVGGRVARCRGMTEGRGRGSRAAAQVATSVDGWDRDTTSKRVGRGCFGAARWRRGMSRTSEANRSRKSAGTKRELTRGSYGRGWSAKRTEPKDTTPLRGGSQRGRRGGPVRVGDREGRSGRSRGGRSRSAGRGRPRRVGGTWGRGGAPSEAEGAHRMEREIDAALGVAASIVVRVGLHPRTPRPALGRAGSAPSAAAMRGMSGNSRRTDHANS